MKNYTDLNIIIDRSGSMSSIAKDMIGGINTFIDSEKKTGDETKVSWFQFDDQYEVIFVDKDITSDFEIQLVPRGGTALLDAIGKTVASVGEKLAKMSEDDRPNRVLFLIITDGQENASKEFSFDAVKTKITHQRETYAWDFVFLGTTEDALFQHQSLGIKGSSSRGFTRDADSIMDTFAEMNCSYQAYKCLDRSDAMSRSATFEFAESGK